MKLPAGHNASNQKSLTKDFKAKLEKAELLFEEIIDLNGKIFSPCRNYYLKEIHTQIKDMRQIANDYDRYFSSNHPTGSPLMYLINRMRETNPRISPTEVADKLNSQFHELELQSFNQEHCQHQHDKLLTLIDSAWKELSRKKK